LKLQIYKTLWGHTGTLELALSQANQAGFDGIEGPAPETVTDALQMKNQLSDSGLGYIAEITTAGTYVPDRRASLQQHVDSFALKLENSMRLDPVFITCLGGVSFETHRSRAFFNPWVTDRIVKQLPQIKLTCDYSHWCVVCERLMDSELDVLERLSSHALHIHARVGYEQGPQVPHPAAPEYQYALRAHQSWWEMIWQQQVKCERSLTTMTPEFGPDGYLQEHPYSREPVGDLWEINRWMANEERRHFNAYMTEKFAWV